MSGSATSAPNPAEAYEQYFVPPLFGPWAAELVRHAQPRPSERVLDVACGAGIVARCIAPLVSPPGRVDALDLSPGMLAVARDVATRAGATITFFEGNAQALPFPDGAYSLVTCQQGLQIVPDRAAAVGEMRRVLTADGRAVVSCWGALQDNPLNAAASSIVEQHLGIPALHAPFALGSASELQSLFDAAGFATVHVEAVTKVARFPEPERWATMAIGALVAALPALQQLSAAERKRIASALQADLDPVLRQFTEDGLLVDARQVHIVHASA